MLLFPTVLIFLSALITGSLGHPAGALAPWVECPALTQWYTCTKNSFRGCCSVDPCDLLSCPPTLPLISVERECAAGTHRIYKPTLYDLNFSNPDIVSPSTSIISLSKSNEQLAIFESIPSSAQNCTFNWATGAVRSFTVSGNGLVDIRVVNETIFTGSYTWNRVHEWVEGIIGNADFTSWTEFQEATDHHVSGSVPCTEEMALWTTISGTKEGSVELAQNSENGWYLEYDC